MPVKYVDYEAGYWRKANQIHSWFVQNVQNGEDDCGNYYVELDKLKELYELVKTVLDSCELVKGKVQNGSRGTPTGWQPIMEDGELIKDPSIAKELLPNTEGFFFGSQGYDQWYVRDLEDTKEMLEKIIANHTDDCEYEYHSSW